MKTAIFESGPERRLRVIRGPDHLRRLRRRTMAPKEYTTAAEARCAGAKHYRTTKPCSRGHRGLRFTSDQSCLACKREDRERRHAENPQQRRATTATYYRNHKQEVLATGRRWVESNRETVNAHARSRRARDRAPRAASEKKWREKNVAILRANEMNRRGRKLGAQTGDRKAYARFVRWARTAPSVSCYWCKKKTSISQRHLDHIIPLARGGADAVGNLCVSCVRCNRRKHVKLPEDFSGQSELRFA
jgi:5-methylcytosine-specific restriction endonuclease McrA